MQSTYYIHPPTHKPALTHPPTQANKHTLTLESPLSYLNQQYRFSARYENAVSMANFLDVRKSQNVRPPTPRLGIERGLTPSRAASPANQTQGRSWMLSSGLPPFSLHCLCVEFTPCRSLSTFLPFSTSFDTSPIYQTPRFRLVG